MVAVGVGDVVAAEVETEKSRDSWEAAVCENYLCLRVTDSEAIEPITPFMVRCPIYIGGPIDEETLRITSSPKKGGGRG